MGRAYGKHVNADLLGHLDLFCGPGGFATGFESAGFTSLMGVDHHAPSIATYALNHPRAKVLLSDIREVTGSELAREVGMGIGVISAGVPCEGFSKANRNRDKFVDERNFLYLEFLRIVEEFMPPYIVLENVRALTTHSKGFFKEEIQSGMEQLGYVVEARVLDAQEYGVPQRRRRVFFVGRRAGWSFAWPEPTHGPGRAAPVTVWDAIGDLPELESGQVATAYDGPPVSSYAQQMRGACSVLTNHEAPSHPKETIDRIARTPQGQPMYESFRQRIRLDQNKPSPTVVSGGIRPQFHYGHPTQARGLTVREQARLQSFPDAYRFEGGIVQGRVQTGDAVPPMLAAAVASRIRDGLAKGAGADPHLLEKVAQTSLLLG